MILRGLTVNFCIRELMDHYEKRNNALRIETYDLLKLTENIRSSKFITEKYFEKAEPLKDITEKVAATNLEVENPKKVENLKKENKENEATIVIRKNKKNWTCPEIESIDQSCFDSLNRHQKGRLKYSQLVNAIAEVPTNVTPNIIKNQFTCRSISSI